jgi:WD40 repeat protein
METAREFPEAMGLRIAFAPDGSAWACSSQVELRVFEGDELVAAEGVAGEVLGDLRFSADGARVLVAPLAYDRAARAWAPRPPVAETLAVGLDPEAAEGFSVHAGAWSADEALALYGEYRPPRRGGSTWSGPTARLVLLDGGRPQVVWEGARSEPRSAIFVGDDIVASGGWAIDVRDRATTRPLAVLDAFGAIARTLRLGDNLFAAGAADGMVGIWDAGSWTELGRWQAHPGEASGLAWRGDTLATGGEDGAVRLWSLEGEKLDETETGAPVTGLAWHGERLLVARAGPAGGVLELRL